MPPLDSLDPNAAPQTAPAPPPVTGAIDTPTQVNPTYDTGGQLVPVYEGGLFRGYERPPGWQRPAPTTGTPQAGTTDAGAPASNPAFDPAAAAGLVKRADGSYAVVPDGEQTPPPGPTKGLPTAATRAGEPFDPAAAAGLVRAPDGSYARPDVAAAPAPTATVESKLQPGQTTGYVANLGAGTTEAISGTLGLPVDLATRAMNLIPQGINALTGTNIPGIQSPVGGSDWWNKVFGLVGANPQQVVPETEMQAVARGAARAVASAALPGGIARMLPEAAGAAEAVREALAAGTSPTAITAAGVGGGFGQSLRDYLGPQSAYGNVADILGNLAGAGLVGVGEAAVRGVGQAAGGGVSLLRGPGAGEAEPIINPATGQPFTETVPPEPGAPPAPIVATPGVQQAATRLLARRAGQTPAQLSRSLAAAPEPGVEGSVPTMGQATGNLRLLGYEGQLRRQEYGRLAFNERSAQNELARVRALKDAQPGDVAHAAGDWFRSKLEAERVADANSALSSREELDQAIADAGLGEKGDVQAEGGRMREGLELLRKSVKRALDAAYAKIDPDGKLTLNVSPVAKAAADIEGSVGMGGELDAIERPVFAAASKFNGIQKFSDLRSLQKNVGAAMRRVSKSLELGRESDPYRRLSQLMGAINGAIAEAAERAIEREMTSAPVEGERIVDQLAGIDEDVSGATGPAVAGEAPAGGVGGAGQPGGAGAPAPAAGSVAGSRPGPGVPARDQGVAAGAPTRAPEDAFSFIRSKGGVQPSQHLTDDANRAVLTSAWGSRAGGKLVDEGGLTLNQMREELAAEGWLRGADANDEHAAANFINNVAAEHAADRKVFKPEDEAAAAYHENLRREAQIREHLWEEKRGELLDAEQDAGMRLSDAEVEHAVGIMVDDPKMAASEALRLAAEAGEEIALQHNAQRNAFGLPGAPLAEQQALELPAHNDLSAENFDATTARGVRETNARYRDYKGTYREGAVGEVTASGARGFRAADSAVPGKLFAKGPKGAEAADSLIKAAGGNVEQAQALLGDYPAMVLRSMAMKSGVFDPKGYQRFLNAYGPALDKFPAIAAKFRTVAEAQRQMEAAAARGKTRIQDLEDSAAGAYLGKTGAGVDPSKAIGTLLNSENPGASFRDLMARAAPNDAAVAGIRRNLLDVILQRARSSAEAGTTLQTGLSGAAMQKILADPKMQAAMEAVLTPAQRRIVQGVADDLMRGARAWNAIKIPGSPGSSAEIMQAMREGRSHLSSFGSLWLGGEMGGMVGHLIAASHPVVGFLARGAGMLVSETVRARRAAAVEDINKLVTEMVLNPDLGRTLLERAPPAGSPLIARLRQKLMAVSLGFGLPSQRTH